MWANGAAYEAYVGRWSRLVAKEFLAWIPYNTEAHWLDVGCGTGALSQTILGRTKPLTITSIDASETFIHYAKQQLSDTRFKFVVGDARVLPFENQAFDQVVSGLMLNFVPEVEKVVTEMVRVTKPGGKVAAYVWDYTGKMQLMRYFWDAVVALNPKGLTPDEGQRYPLCQPKPLTELFQRAGLEHVEVRAIDVPTYFRDFDDYWSPFLLGQGPAPAYAMSLSEEARASLREHLWVSLPSKADSSIHLVARAWAVRGTKQS
jgi:2-polyprenyl-3-methyl-5-hydroxy-6-metoxy-1,4-benzoquinol methylase